MKMSENLCSRGSVGNSAKLGAGLLENGQNKDSHVSTRWTSIAS